MRKVYVAVGAVAVLGWVVLGLIVARGPQPEIIVPAEIITKLGPLNVSNTLISAWAAMIILAVVTFLGTRAMKLVPRGAQNFLESVVEFLFGQMEDIAGEKNTRRFFPVIATFFLFVLLSNWMGLLPFFNAIGKTEDIGHHIFHEIEEHAADGTDFKEEIDHASGWLMDKTGGIGLVPVPNGAGSAEFEMGASEDSKVSPAKALDRYVVFLAETFSSDQFADQYVVALAEAFTDFEVDDGGEVPSEDEAPLAETLARAREALAAAPNAPSLSLEDALDGDPSPELVRAARRTLDADPAAPNLLSGDDHGHVVASAALGEELTVGGIEFPGQQLALIIPLFRSVYSDVNNTIALALISFAMVEFWGLRALGLGYLRKFFNFSGVIPAFVGILELLSEFIRIISFAFRLFGNIFAGEVLILMLTFLLPFLIVDIIYGLELFVGFIQAAVFALLTLVFAVMAVEHHDEDGEGHEGEAGHATESRGSAG